jgi:hypothetical protein
MPMNTIDDDTNRLFFMLWIKRPEDNSVIRTSGGYDSLVDGVADNVVYFLLVGVMVSRSFLCCDLLVRVVIVVVEVAVLRQVSTSKR